MSQSSLTKIVLSLQNEIELHEKLLNHHRKARGILHMLLVSNLADHSLETIHNNIDSASDIIEQAEKCIEQRMNVLLELLAASKQHPLPPEGSPIH